MRRLQTTRLTEGMVLARPLQDATGRVLARASNPLTADLVARIQRLDVDCVYVEDDRFAGLEFWDDLPAPILAQTRELFASLAGSFPKGSTPTVDPAAAKPLLDALEDSIDAGAPLALIRHGDETSYLPVQALNTARLCLAAAPHIRAGSHARDLAAAALLHDVGMLGVPDEVRARQGPLTPAEVEVVHGHVQVSIEALRHPYWSPFVKVSVAQHHERADGSGYPAGRVADGLHPLGSLLAAADYYCALVTPRPHRPAYRPEEALEMLLGLAGWQLSAPAVRAICGCVGLYARGTVVRLSNGQEAVVTHAGRGTFERPQVRLLDSGAAMDLRRPECLSTHILAVVDG